MNQVLVAQEDQRFTGPLQHDNFKELTEALERHRKGTPLKKVHYYPPQTPPSYVKSLPQQDGFRDVHLNEQDEAIDSEVSDRHSEPSSSRSSSPTLDAPGQYISEDEDAGLPGTKDLKLFSFKKARRLVQAHLHRGPEFWNSRTSLPSPEIKRSREGVSIDNEKDTEDQEGSSVEGKGILSTLLNLYLQRDQSHSEKSSRRSSIETTRVSGDSATKSFSGLLSHPPSPSSRSTKSSRKLTSPRLPAVLGGIHRPSTARSAGGVFGPLIASTGNLAGVAAPQASTLQPNVKAPGYRLSR